MLLSQLGVWTRSTVLELLLLHLHHDGLAVLVNSEHLLLVHLLLVHQKLLLLLRAQLLQKLLLLLRVKALKCLHKLHLLLKLCLLLGYLSRALMETGVNNVLALSLFLLRGHLVDDLFLILGFLGGE